MRSVRKLLCLALLLPALVQAQPQINGQIRTRTEIDDRDFNSDTDPASSSLLRTRVGIKSPLSERIHAFVQIQDSRIYGTEPNTLTSTANIDLHQAYFQIDRLFWNWLSIKNGRMELNYGSQRLIGAVGWHNVGRAFDGGVTTLSFAAVEIDLFSTIVKEQGKDDATFSGIYFTFDKKPAWLRAWQVYLLADIDDAADRELGTLGTYGKMEFGSIDVESEIALQGEERDDTDIVAYMITAAAGYQFGGPMQPRLGIGIDILSGDDPSTGDYEAFHTLYATNHKFYGYMDYFLDIPAHTNDLGLTDLMLRGSIQPRDKMTVKGDLHIFTTSEEDPVSKSSDIGSEIDLTFVYEYAPKVGYTAGLSIFSPGDVVKKTGLPLASGKDAAFWLYSQIVVDF